MRADGSLRGLRCLVTGAGGFIGQAIVAMLKREHAVVTGFGRQPARYSFDQDVQWVNGQFDDMLALTQACLQQEVVIHLLNSSTPETATRQPAGDVIANVAPSIALLEACVAAGVGRFVFASSGGTVYGPTARTPIIEDAPTSPISAYGVSKLAIEKYAAMFEHIHGLDHRILRISNPYGPGQSPFRGQGVIAAFFHSALRGEPITIWGDGSVVRDYIYIDDVASAVRVALLHNGKERIFNVGSGVGRSINEIVADMRQVVAAPVVIERLPGRPVDVPVNILDVSRIERAGWRPTTEWVEGLRRTAAWMSLQDVH